MPPTNVRGHGIWMIKQNLCGIITCMKKGWKTEILQVITIIGLKRISAVSYTHLDVYKRQGPVITETEIKQLKDKILSLLHPNDFVVLSGNVSAQVRKDIYRELIELVKQQGARVILDADGELFAQGIQAKPYVIKPNKYELATYFGVSQDCSNEEMISLAKTLLNEECRLVVVSMGKQGSIFLSHEGCLLYTSRCV